MSDNRFNENFRTAIEGIKSMADANTVIGEAITTANGTTIIPISKLSMGYASGGLDYKSKKAEPAAQSNFGGAGGSGLTVTPIAFLIISPNGSVEMLNVNQPVAAGASDPVSSIIGLIERSPDLIERLRAAIGKDSKPAAEEE